MAKLLIEATQAGEDWLHERSRVRARQDEKFRVLIGVPPPRPITGEEAEGGNDDE